MRDRADMSAALDELTALCGEQLAQLRAGDTDAFVAGGEALAAGWAAFETSGVATVEDLPRIGQLRAAMAELDAEAGIAKAEISARLSALARSRTANSAYLRGEPSPASRRREA
jgi:hypothetical protein